MENKTTRPVGSHHRAPRANTNQPIAAPQQPKPWERSLYPRAAPIASRPKETPTTTGSNIPAPGPNRRPTSSAPVYSRPGPASRPALNSSRLQGVSGTGGASPFAARPNMRGRAVRDVGFDNWALRNESIMAHPVRAPLRGRPSRIPSAIPEEDEESDVLPALPSPSPVPTTSEMQMRWQGETARRSPAMVHAGAAPARSQVGSLVAATESAAPKSPARHSWPKRAPRPAVLPSSPLRHSIGHAPENVPRTYLDMHARYERAPTRLMRKSPGAMADWGENFSPFCAGTTARDIRRRAGLGLKAPLPGSAVLERRVFGAPFVDAPTVIGGRREMRGFEREMERVKAEVVPEPLQEEKGERKKGWQRASAFLARKMSLKAKGAASPSASPATSSLRTPPATPPALVYSGSSSDASPARAPATPPQVRFATPVVISDPPTSTPRKATAEKNRKQPVSPPTPFKTALKRTSPPCSQLPQREHFARAITAASALAPRWNYDLQPTADEEEEEEEEEEHSPLSDVDDADVFPSPLVTSQRWARPESFQHEAVADALAEETAAADWSGALKQAERVRYVGKGKGRMVDVRPRPARYHGRRVVAEAPVVGVAGNRRDTLVGERVPRAWPLDEVEGSKRPVVAISGLHR